MARLLTSLCLAVLSFAAAAAGQPYAVVALAGTDATAARTELPGLAGIGDDPPLCGVEPTILDFGTVSAQSYEEQIFELSNLGGGTLTGTVSETCSDYQIVIGGGFYSLGPGEFIVVVVRFAPGSAGTKTCEIQTGAACANVFCTGVGEDECGGVDDGGREIPGTFALSQNAPNPFRQDTAIRFHLPYDVRVRVSVYSVAGERIAVLADGVLPAGEHEVVWTALNRQARKVPPGVYFCRLEAGGLSRTVKMLLLE